MQLHISHTYCLIYANILALILSNILQFSLRHSQWRTLDTTLLGITQATIALQRRVSLTHLTYQSKHHISTTFQTQKLSLCHSLSLSLCHSLSLFKMRNLGHITLMTLAPGLCLELECVVKNSYTFVLNRMHSFSSTQHHNPTTLTHFIRLFH